LADDDLYAIYEAEYEISFEFRPEPVLAPAPGNSGDGGQPPAPGGWYFSPKTKENSSITMPEKTALTAHCDETESILSSDLNCDGLKWYYDGLELSTDRLDEIILEHIVRNRTLDQIEVLLSVVGPHVTWEVRGLQEKAPCWSYERSQDGKDIWAKVAGQFALIFPSLFFDRDGDRNWRAPSDRAAKMKVTAKLLACHRQRKQFTVRQFEHNGGKTVIKFHVKVWLVHYEKGAICHAIPIPGKQPKPTRVSVGEPLSVHSPEVVLANGLVEDDLLRLSQVWQDRFARCVLICGPPGSGKENYAQSLPYGAGRRGRGVPVISLGEAEDEELLQRLYGCKKDDGTESAGLIEQAKHSAIFVDEAHYPTDRPGVRKSLLRVLEAGAYYPVRSDRVKDVEDVLWVFASSRDVSGPRSIGLVPPEDFWTRMTHLVQVHHPLNAEDLRRVSARQAGEEANGVKPLDIRAHVKESQKTALRHLFKFFWIMRLEEFYDREIPRPSRPEEGKGDAADYVIARKLRRLLRENVLSLIAEKYSIYMLEEIGSLMLHTLSIRGIRSVVSQLLGHAMRRIEEPENPSTIGTENDAVIQECESRIPEVVEQVRQVATLSRSVL